MGHLVMDPGRRGCGSASGRRVSLVSGRIRGACTSRVRGHSERSLYATGRAAILKPAAVGCRVGMSGLRNKAICDEIRKFGYPISWLKPPPPACWYGGEMVELLWLSVAIPPSRASRMLPVIRIDNPDTRAGPYRPEPESELGLRWSRRPRRPSWVLRGGCSAPGRHVVHTLATLHRPFSTMDRHLGAAVASSASLCASDGLLTGWIRPQLGGSAFGLSEGPGSQ